MKVSSLLNWLKSVKKQLKGVRLIIFLAVVAVLLVGATSAAIYTLNPQSKKIQPVLVEEVIDVPASPAPKEEKEVPVAAKEEEPVVPPANTQPTPSVNKNPVVNQATKPRPHTSEDPAYVVCTQKYSDLYVKYNADNASINVEKSLALATIDELYNSGYYAQMYPGDTDPYNQWQIDRAELVTYYIQKLADLYSTYQTNSSVYLNC